MNTDTIRVDPWPSERPLTISAFLIAAAFWLVLVISVFGVLYALLVASFFMIAHVMMIAYIRGNSVRLGPNQFPELYEAVATLSARVGLERVPETYLMQAGGELNAFATKYFRGNFIVLYSELLDACQHNTAARDMVIAHELGHVKAGHLSWMWFLWPAYLFPWPGRALSRAREYTCDRYGMAGAGDKDGALLGLTVLAAGGRLGPHVNREAMAAQEESLRSLGMRWAQMYMSHPPLVRRIAALDPSLTTRPVPIPGPTYAIASVGVALVIALGVAYLGQTVTSLFKSALNTPASSELDLSNLSGRVTDTAQARESVSRDFAALRQFLTDEVAAGRTLPADMPELYDRWKATHGSEGPFDPFDGAQYGYITSGSIYRLVSSGPDREPDTDDDITYQSDQE